MSPVRERGKEKNNETSVGDKANMRGKRINDTLSNNIYSV